MKHDHDTPFVATALSVIFIGVPLLLFAVVTWRRELIRDIIGL